MVREQVAYNLHQKALQEWSLCYAQTLNRESNIWLNPLVHLALAVLEHNFDKLRCRFNVIVLQIFITHYLE